jgi:hypothetical protein
MPNLRQRFPEVPSDDLETIEAVRNFTMTSAERILALCQAIRYLVQNQIAGDLVECGVWRGGSVMAALRTLKLMNDVERRVWLYDTFEGMSPPTARDVDHQGKTADELLREDRPDDPNSIWCRSSLAEVRKNVAGCGYPAAKLRYVVGPVEQTLPKEKPDRIALLRLDTDWYESTRVELHELFPRLVPGGVLLIDDYGHWQGCRRAVDEFFREHGICMLLHRIDYTGRIGVQAGLSSKPMQWESVT